MFDSGQKKLALILIGLGAVLLVGNLLNFDFGDIFWPIVIILFGLFLVFRPQVINPVNAKVSFVGDIEVDETWDLAKDEVRMFVGDFHFDLENLDLPLGETNFRIYAFVGEVNMRVPKDIGVSISSEAFVTESKIDGEKMENVFTGFDYKSEGYENAKKKFNLSMRCFVSEIKLRYK